MTKTFRISIFLVLALCAASCSDTLRDDMAATETLPVATDCEQGEVIVKFDAALTDALDRMTAGRETRLGVSSVDEALAILGAYDLERVFPVDPNTEERTRQQGMHLWYLVRFDESRLTVDEAVRQLSLLGEVQRVQANRHVYPSYNRQRRAHVVGEEGLAAARARSAATLPFDDPGLANQWGYINDGTLPFGKAEAPVLAGCDVGCEEAWQMCQGDSSIIVAVIDEGVMYNHPDLAAHMWVNERETLGSDTDADGNGYCGDRHGYNFVRNSGFISCFSVNDSGHGTHVAGTIAAVNNNGIGVCGIAGGNGTGNGVRIMSLQIFDDNKVASLVSEAKAIKYAADNGAVIIQCSWGYNSNLANPLDGFTPGPATAKEWEEAYPLEKEAIDYFVHNAGSPSGVIDGGLAIFASGNEYSGSSAFPGGYDNCLSVSALAADYTPSSYSNYGWAVDLCAPGGDEEYYATVGHSDDYADWTLPQGLILSTLCIDGAPAYGYFEGTSMACPNVVGVAALGLSYAAQKRRHFTWSEFSYLLCETARDIDPYLAERGEKTYHLFHNAWGGLPIVMNLNNYRGKMGRLVDAGALLRAIEQSGHDMRIPNVYVALGKTSTLDLARFFVDGEKKTYNCSVTDTSVATLSLAGTRLTIAGKAEGTTSLTVTPSGLPAQTVTITVRNGANNHGWL